VTETAPTISTTHWATDTPGELGLLAPGVELKLIPAGDTYEARVRGPNVTPGYLGRPDLTSAAFDDEGFYRVGDTVSFIDPANPSSVCDSPAGFPKISSSQTGHGWLSVICEQRHWRRHTVSCRMSSLPAKIVNHAQCWAG
jgi:acyl-CoA synthetase (AMP-forming)/AMP-acid ligase II